MDFWDQEFSSCVSYMDVYLFRGFRWGWKSPTSEKVYLPEKKKTFKQCFNWSCFSKSPRLPLRSAGNPNFEQRCTSTVRYLIAVISDALTLPSQEGHPTAASEKVGLLHTWTAKGPCRPGSLPKIPGEGIQWGEPQVGATKLQNFLVMSASYWAVNIYIRSLHVFNSPRLQFKVQNVLSNRFWEACQELKYTAQKDVQDKVEEIYKWAWYDNNRKWCDMASDKFNW